MIRSLRVESRGGDRRARLVPSPPKYTKRVTSGFVPVRQKKVEARNARATSREKA